MREVRRRLQQQRGLADARLAADQHERARHDAAAQHAIELADAGRQPLGDDGVDVGVQLRARRSTARLYRSARLLSAADRQPRDRALLDQRIPRAALRRSARATSADCAPHS